MNGVRDAKQAEQFHEDRWEQSILQAVQQIALKQKNQITTENLTPLDSFLHRLTQRQTHEARRKTHELHSL